MDNNLISDKRFDWEESAMAKNKPRKSGSLTPSYSVSDKVLS
jgi:hypothetical protein